MAGSFSWAGTGAYSVKAVVALSSERGTRYALDWWALSRQENRGERALVPSFAVALRIEWAARRCYDHPPSSRSIPLHSEAAGAAPLDAFGPFRVLHQIGAGARGPVFRAYDP